MIKKFHIGPRDSAGDRRVEGDVLIEVDTTLDQNQEVGAGDGTPFLEDALEMLKGPIRAIHAGLEEIADDVDSISISFGVKYSTGLDLVIFTLGTESNIDVQVTWNRKQTNNK